MTGRHRGGRSLKWRQVTAMLTAAFGRGYLGLHRREQMVLGVSVPAVEPVRAFEPVEGPVEVPVAALPELVRQPELVTAACARLSLVPVRRSPDPLVDTVPHPVIRLFPLPVAEPVPVADETHADLVLPDGSTDAVDVGGYRSRHSA